MDCDSKNNPVTSDKWVHSGCAWNWKLDDKIFLNAPEFLKPWMGKEYYYFRMVNFNYYVLRPNERTIGFLDKYMHLVFPNGYLPDGMNTVFIRTGDKGTESPLPPLKDYIEILEKHDISKHKNWWVGSDDVEMINEIKIITRGYNLWINEFTERSPGGITWNEMLALNKSGGEKLNQFTENVLVELYLSSLGRHLVCMYSSNWCRMVISMRDMFGNAKYPFFDMVKKSQK